jgi:hypothetical protein
LPWAFLPLALFLFGAGKGLAAFEDQFAERIARINQWSSLIVGLAREGLFPFMGKDCWFTAPAGFVRKDEHVRKNCTKRCLSAWARFDPLFLYI